MKKAIRLRNDIGFQQIAKCIIVVVDTMDTLIRGVIRTMLPVTLVTARCVVELIGDIRGYSAFQGICFSETRAYNAAFISLNLKVYLVADDWCRSVNCRLNGVLKIIGE